YQNCFFHGTTLIANERITITAIWLCHQPYSNKSAHSRIVSSQPLYLRRSYPLIECGVASLTAVHFPQPFPVCGVSRAQLLPTHTPFRLRWYSRRTQRPLAPP